MRFAVNYRPEGSDKKEERKVRYGYGYNSRRAETGTAGNYI